MRISLNWIREYVDIEEAPEALASRLTLAGLPVDQVETASPLPDTVVVGKVVEAGKHPNAERLSLCKVDAGTGELLDIVCGAPNARAGMYSPVALVGTTLPNGVTIKKAKIRGQESRGMLCSEIELGLGDDADGIMEIPPGEPDRYIFLPDNLQQGVRCFPAGKHRRSAATHDAHLFPCDLIQCLAQPLCIIDPDPHVNMYVNLR